MTRPWTALLVTLAACRSAPLPHSPPSPAPAVDRAFTADDEAAVRAVLARQQEAWNRGDLDGYMRGYAHSDALVFTSGSKVRRGFTETFEKYKARYGSDPSTMGTLAFEILAVQPLGADGAIVLGRWQLTNTPVAGSGIFSVALERLPGGWLVVHDHTSSDAP
jgi:ketosteroid isomerase-like protein